MAPSRQSWRWHSTTNTPQHPCNRAGSCGKTRGRASGDDGGATHGKTGTRTLWVAKWGNTRTVWTRVVLPGTEPKHVAAVAMSSSTVFDAKCCQPWRGWKRSVSSGTGGRTSTTNSNQLGNTQPQPLTRDAGHLTTTIEALQHDAHDLRVGAWDNATPTWCPECDLK